MEKLQRVITPALGIVAGNGLPGAFAVLTSTALLDDSVAEHWFPTSVAAEALVAPSSEMTSTAPIAAEMNFDLICLSLSRGSGEHIRASRLKGKTWLFA